MATKAHRFKDEAMRRAHGKKAPGNTHESAGKRAADRGRTKDRLPNQTSHNEGARARKNGLYQLEYDATSRPPRKSGRGSPTHVKTDSSLRIAVTARTVTPQARNGRRARRTGGRG